MIYSIKLHFFQFFWKTIWEGRGEIYITCKIPMVQEGQLNLHEEIFALQECSSMRKHSRPSTDQIPLVSVKQWKLRKIQKNKNYLEKNERNYTRAGQSLRPLNYTREHICRKSKYFLEQYLLVVYCWHVSVTVVSEEKLQFAAILILNNDSL